MKLEGNTIVVTGGTSGIGYELAAQLLARGNTVLVTGRSQGALDATARKLPNVHVFRCDVRDAHAVTTLREEVLHAFRASTSSSTTPAS